MSQMLISLLKSKRTWVTILTIVAHVLAKHHVVFTDADVSDLADQVIIAIGALCVVGTKVLDSRKASQPAQLEAPGQKP